MTSPGDKPQLNEVFAVSDEAPAPHLSSDAASPSAEEEVWTPAPIETARALTDEEKWPGEWHAICWMHAHGASQRNIARELDYTESRISVILNKPQVQEKIEAIRREVGAASLNKRFENIAPKAVDFMSRVIEGKEAVKAETRVGASQWMLEKVTGKPKQEGHADGGTTILQLLHALDAVGKVKAAATEDSARKYLTENTKDVTPEPRDPLADWVSDNIPEFRDEKGGNSGKGS